MAVASFNCSKYFIWLISYRKLVYCERKILLNVESACATARKGLAQERKRGEMDGERNEEGDEDKNGGTHHLLGCVQ